MRGGQSIGLQPPTGTQGVGLTDRTAPSVIGFDPLLPKISEDWGSSPHRLATPKSCWISLERDRLPASRSIRGEVAERLKAAVLKTARVKALVGSNPTLSAIELAASHGPRSDPQLSPTVGQYFAPAAA